MVYKTVRLLKQVTAFQTPSAEELVLSAQEAANEILVGVLSTSAGDFSLALQDSDRQAVFKPLSSMGNI